MLLLFFAWPAPAWGIEFAFPLQPVDALGGDEGDMACNWSTVEDPNPEPVINSRRMNAKEARCFSDRIGYGGLVHSMTHH